jgi:anti-anti-sigma regulatory factor
VSRRQAPALVMTIQWSGGTEAIASVRGVVDDSAALELAGRIIEAGQVVRALSGRYGRLIVDLADATFTDRAGIRALRAARRALAGQCQLVLRNCRADEPGGPVLTGAPVL